MRYKKLLFDLDDTLYPHQAGLWDAIKDRMNLYMYERLGLDNQEIPALRTLYFQKYGTTLGGLQEHHDVDSEDFLRYVHDIPLEKYLDPSPQLRIVLQGLPQQLWVFTNADAAHAHRVLEALELSGCFDGILDIHALGFQSKPGRSAFRAALEKLGDPDPMECMFFDDSPVNLAAAKEFGITTVLVGLEEAGSEDSGVDYVLPSLLELPQRMAFLYDGSSSRG